MLAHLLANGERTLCNDDTAEAPAQTQTEPVASNDNENEHIDGTQPNTSEMLTCYQCQATDGDSVQQLDDDHIVVCPPAASDNGCYHMIKGEWNQIASLRRRFAKISNHSNSIRQSA